MDSELKYILVSASELKELVAQRAEEQRKHDARAAQKAEEMWYREAQESQNSTRFLLADSLSASGERAEAEGEWQSVAVAGGSWAELVAETLQDVRQARDEGAA